MHVLNPKRPQKAKAPKKRRVLESSIENKAVARAKEFDIVSRKMNGLGMRAWPDRLFVLPRDSGVAWVEFKKPGEKPTKQQDEVMKDLKRRGQRVTWFDDADKAVQWLLSFLKK